MRVQWKIFCFIVFGLAAGTVCALDTLDQAIEREAAYIIDRAPKDSVLAVVSIQSDSTGLSDYIMERFPDYLIQNRKNLTFVDRGRLDLIQKEINFQYSGEVSDETMVSIGEKIGAQIIITGAVSEAVDSYNFGVKMLDVRTAKILGSNSTKIAHDSKMESYLPSSGVSRYITRQEEEARAKKDSTVRTVKNVLGIFPNGFYLGYLGSLNAPVGVSLGWLNTGMAFFVDNQFGPPSFKDYERSSSVTYDGGAIKNAASGYRYEDAEEKTAFIWDCTLGFNINLIESLLWTDIGAGIEYKQQYRLFTESGSSSGSSKTWLEHGDSFEDRLRFAISAGLFVKLWYFYVQAKYKYVVGDEIDYSTYGMNQVSVGAGYVWKR